MVAGPYIPTLVSAGNVNPYRFVALTANNHEGAEAGNNAAAVVGVSEGWNKEFDSAFHAEVGDPIALQTGPVVKVEAGAALATIGANINSGADGRAEAAGAGENVHAITLQVAAAAGDIIEVYFDRLGTVA